MGWRRDPRRTPFRFWRPIMTSPTLRPRLGFPLASVAFLFASWAGRAEAQFGIGVAYPGVPFLYYTPERAPSPTQYLYDREAARIEAYGNALQQQATASQMASTNSDSNAYYNRLRDYSGESTYQVQSRKSLSERRSPPNHQPPSAPAPKPDAAHQTSLPIDAFFLADGTFDWPRDAPD